MIRLFNITVVLRLVACFGVLLFVAHVQPVSAQAYGQDSIFFDGADDIPVMPGTHEADARGFRFDKPEGEIVEVYADIGSFAPQQVLAFYTKTLPQLGWGRVDSDSFYRDEQQLDISFSHDGGVHMMRILIRPSL